MWLWDNWNRPNRGWNWYFMVGWTSFVIAIGFFFMGAGVSSTMTEVSLHPDDRHTVLSLRSSTRTTHLAEAPPGHARTIQTPYRLTLHALPEIYEPRIIGDQ
jgi:hypothetical protein